MKDRIIKKVFSFVFPHINVQRDQIKAWLKIDTYELDEYIDLVLELRSNVQREISALRSDSTYASAFTEADPQLISSVVDRFEDQLRRLEVEPAELESFVRDVIQRAVLR